MQLKLKLKLKSKVEFESKKAAPPARVDPSALPAPRQNFKPPILPEILLRRGAHDFLQHSVHGGRGNLRIRVVGAGHRVESNLPGIAGSKTMPHHDRASGGLNEPMRQRHCRHRLSKERRLYRVSAARQLIEQHSHGLAASEPAYGSPHRRTAGGEHFAVERSEEHTSELQSLRR